MSDKHTPETIAERLEALERRLTNLEQQVGVWPLPGIDVPVEEVSNKCPQCAIVWEGVMGYVCNRSDCPYGNATFGINTGG